MAVHKLQRQQQEVECQLWPAIIKYARLRSLFKALKMFCFNKCKSNLRTLSEKIEGITFSIILWSPLTR